MTEKQEKVLPAMLRAFLLVSPQSESANQNVLKIIDILPKETKAELFKIMQTDLKSRLNQQAETLQAQIDAIS